MSGYACEVQLKVGTGLPCSNLTGVKKVVRKTTSQQSPRVYNVEDRWNELAQLTGHLAHRDFKCKQHCVLPYTRNWAELPRADICLTHLCTPQHHLTMHSHATSAAFCSSPTVTSFFPSMYFLSFLSSFLHLLFCFGFASFAHASSPE